MCNMCMCNVDDALWTGMIGQHYRKVVAIGQQQMPTNTYKLQGFVKM